MSLAWAMRVLHLAFSLQLDVAQLVTQPLRLVARSVRAAQQCDLSFHAGSGEIMTSPVWLTKRSTNGRTLHPQRRCWFENGRWQTGGGQI